MKPRKVWYESDPALYAEAKGRVESSYPTLHFSIRNFTVYISGSFPLADGGKIFDRYSIEIELPHDYPQGLPLVWEVGGRIARIADRHIYSDTGSACLFVRDEREWVYPSGSSVLDFLNGPVRDFFVSQSLYEIDGTWPFGQRSHGVKGIAEFYFEKLNTTDLQTVLRYLNILKRKEIKGHWLCPCGSGTKLRQCHREQLTELRSRIPQQVACRSWRAILSLGR